MILCPSEFSFCEKRTSHPFLDARQLSLASLGIPPGMYRQTLKKIEDEKDAKKRREKRTRKEDAKKPQKKGREKRRGKKTRKKGAKKDVKKTHYQEREQAKIV